MKVLLTTDVDKVGAMGAVVEVKAGFARNYLFPRKLAVEATPHQVALVAGKRKKLEKKLEIEKLSAVEQKSKLDQLVLKIRKKAGENDVLFGSVTTAEIEEEFARLGVHVDRKKIHLDEPIKRIGHYTCRIKLFKDVDAEVRIEVGPENTAAQE
jgi:large subunit ribosomal protein L9